MSSKYSSSTNYNKRCSTSRISSSRFGSSKRRISSSKRSGISSSLNRSLKRSFISSIFGGGKAGGGPVESGRLYRVNEKRPELLDVNGQQFLMMGAQRGRIDPNPRLAGGGGTTVHAPITLMMQPGTSQQSANQAANTIAVRLRRASMRNG